MTLDLPPSLLQPSTPTAASTHSRFPALLRRLPVPLEFLADIGPGKERTFGRLVPYLLKTTGLIAFALYRRCPFTDQQYVATGPKFDAILSDVSGETQSHLVP